MDAEYLTNLVRCTGALVALVASFLAAPAATRHLWEAGPRRWAVSAGRTVAVQGRAGMAQARRAWDRLRGHRPARQVAAQGGSSSLGLTASLTATGTLTLTVDPAAPLAERVKRLEQHVETLKALHEANKQAIAKEAVERQEMVQRVSDRIGQEAAAIRSEIAAMEQNEMLMDARAVPVIGVGIVLTSIPDLIARSTTLSALAVAAALTFLTWAWIHFWASGPAGAASQARLS